MRCGQDANDMEWVGRAGHVIRVDHMLANGHETRDILIRVGK
jgi:hypothetical protein